jgi:hypothetical protein
MHPTNTRDLDDMPAALFAQVGQRRLRYPQGPKQVRLQSATRRSCLIMETVSKKQSSGRREPRPAGALPWPMSCARGCTY